MGANPNQTADRGVLAIGAQRINQGNDMTISRRSALESQAIQIEARGPAGGKSKRPHVCFLAPSIFPILSESTDIELAGGAEVQQVVLARMLQADGYPVSVLSADFGQAEVVDCAGVRVHRLPPAGTRGVKGLRFIYPHTTDLVAGLKRIDPDIVYFRAAGGGTAAAAWYARRWGRKFVYACAHDLEFRRSSPFPPDRRDAFLFRRGLQKADGVLVQNLVQQRLLKENFGKDAFVVPNCYAEPEAGRADPNGHVLWVATVKAIKRPDLFIELARRFPAKQFTMVGGADQGSEGGQAQFRRMQEVAAGLPNLRFLGYIPFAQVGRLFDGASVFVNTSDSEGFPNTFLQAWIRGVPTVSFVRPEVIPGETGTIVCSDIEHMVRQVKDLTTQVEAWRLASQACSQHFNNRHSVQAVLQGYRSIFDSLKDSHGE